MQSSSSLDTTAGGAADSSSDLNSYLSSTPLTSPSSSRASSQLCDRCKLGWAPTFPASLVPEHLDWFPTFKNNLNEALEGKNRKGSYTSVSALLLSWTGDDIGVRDEIRELNDLFKNDFGFNTEYWSIPDLDAEDLLEARLLEFKIKRKDPTGLLIVYYGGHGGVDRNTGELYWAAIRQGSPSLLWSRLQAALFERYKGDVFLILDCCHAAAAARPIRDDTKEVLAACAIESTTTSNGDFTFTKFLMRHLRLLLQQYGTERFSIFQLHASMCADKKLLISPVHAIVSGNRPIELAPQSLQGPSQHLTIPSLSSLAIRDEKRVLVSIHLNGDHEQQYEAWKDWLAMSPPSGVSEVVIEGLFQGNSSLLLISLPTRVWAFLPDHPAIAFVGLVASDNIFYRGLPTPTALKDIDKVIAPGGKKLTLGESLFANLLRMKLPVVIEKQVGWSNMPTVWKMWWEDRRVRYPLIFLIIIGCSTMALGLWQTCQSWCRLLWQACSENDRLAWALKASMAVGWGLQALGLGLRLGLGLWDQLQWLARHDEDLLVVWRLSIVTVVAFSATMLVDWYLLQRRLLWQACPGDDRLNVWALRTLMAVAWGLQALGLWLGLGLGLMPWDPRGRVRRSEVRLVVWRLTVVTVTAISATMLADWYLLQRLLLWQACPGDDRLTVWALRILMAVRWGPLALGLALNAWALRALMAGGWARLELGLGLELWDQLQWLDRHDMDWPLVWRLTVMIVIGSGPIALAYWSLFPEWKEFLFQDFCDGDWSFMWRIGAEAVIVYGAITLLLWLLFWSLRPIVEKSRSRHTVDGNRSKT